MEFTHDKIKPANPRAERLAGAVLKLISEDQELQNAKSRDDYYAVEQESFNRAADELYEIVMKINWKNERIFKL